MIGRYSQSGRKFSHGWDIKLDERNLWFGRTRAELRFDAAFVLQDIAPRGDEQAHNWVCAAPQCGVKGTITLNSGKCIEFQGTGYHDHNYGMLPWTDIDVWRWERVHFAKDSELQGAVHYRWSGNKGDGAFLAVWDRRGEMRTIDARMEDQSLGKITYAPGTTFFGSQQKHSLTHIRLESADDAELPTLHITEPDGWSQLQTAPFYRRFPTVVHANLADDSTASGIGIGEQFIPARLAGPIMSRALWTRMRRRS